MANITSYLSTLRGTNDGKTIRNAIADITEAVNTDNNSVIGLLGGLNPVEIAAAAVTATTKAGEAAGSADDAMDSQVVATAQAGIATTKAAEALASKNAAAASEVNSAASEQAAAGSEAVAITKAGESAVSAANKRRRNMKRRRWDIKTRRWRRWEVPRILRRSSKQEKVRSQLAKKSVRLIRNWQILRSKLMLTHQKLQI